MRLALVLMILVACEEQRPAPQVAPPPRAPSRALCQQLFEHMVDLELAKSGVNDQRQRAAILDAKSSEFMTACTTKTPLRVVECGVAAKDLDALAACDR